MAKVHPFHLFTPSALPLRPVGVGWGVIGAPRPTRAPVPSAPAARPRRRPLERSGEVPGAHLWVALLLLLAALLVAPEQPWDQEAICQRHSGVEACRVW